MIYVLLGAEIVLLITATVLIVTAFAVLFHWKQSLPFIPIGRRHVKRMLKEVDIQPDDKVVDIGAGWGSLIFPAAKQKDNDYSCRCS